MTAYTPIADSEIDPESPATTSLFQRLRDNVIAAFEGQAAAPRLKPAILHVTRLLASGVTDVGITGGIWNDRLPTDIITNTITGATLSSGTIVLPTGTYDVEIFVPCRGTNLANVAHQARLYNTSDSVEVLSGTSAESAIAGSSISAIHGRFTIAAAKNFKLQTFADGTTNGGAAVTSGSGERYLDAVITKVA